MNKVSVIIPTYNRPEYLEGAVDTAVNQDYDDLEVIVVDDCSDTDYAEKVTSRYPDLVRCISFHENTGGLRQGTETSKNPRGTTMRSSTTTDG